MVSVFRFFWRQTPFVLLLASVLGLVVRLTSKDAFRATAPIYYATPPGVIGGFALVAGLLWIWRGERRLGQVLLAMAAACFLWHGTVNWQQHSPSAAPDRIRVVFWNACRGELGFEGIVRDLRELDADVIGIAEAGVNRPETLAAWQTALPEYSVSHLTAGVLLACKGTISDERNGVIGYRSLYKDVRMHVGGKTLRVLLADVCSTVTLDRNRMLSEITRVVESCDGEPLLLMGDFNTPADSVHFESLRRLCSNAFETAGAGYASTWPLPLPCIQIDHIWATEGVDILSCRHGWSWHSDHRPVVVEVAVKEMTNDEARMRKE